MPKLKQIPSTFYARSNEATGHQMAADMMKQIRKHWLAREKGVPDDEIGDLWKREKSRILRVNVKAVERLNNEAVAKGFYAVLTDFIGYHTDGAEALLDRYARSK